jgi:signal transduction histidine kinase
MTKAPSRAEIRLIKRLEAAEREQQIHAAVDSVLHRALAMEAAEDIAHAVEQTRDALVNLGLDPVTTHIAISDRDRDLMRLWGAWQNDRSVVFRQGYRFSLSALRKSGSAYYAPRRGRQRLAVIRSNRRQLTSEHSKLHKAQLPGNPEWQVAGVVARMPSPNYRHNFYFSGGWIGLDFPHELKKPEIAVAHRIADAFNVAYKRFVELQDKEQRTREAEIQASLERVRARALGMQESDDIGTVTEVLFQEERRLGLDPLHAIIGLDEGDTVREFIRVDFANPDRLTMYQLTLDKARLQDPYLNGVWDAWGEEEGRLTLHFDIERVEQMLEATNDGRRGHTQPTATDLGPFHQTAALFPEFFLVLNTCEPVDDEAFAILQRFGRVFGVAYRRFRELQDKEAQNHELTIQNALERVRARALGMQESSEIGEVVWQIFNECRELDFPILETRIALLFEDETREMWSSSLLKERDHFIRSPFSRSPEHNEARTAWKRGDLWQVSERREDEWREIYRQSGLDAAEIDQRIEAFGNTTYMHRSFFKEGAVIYRAPVRLAENALGPLKLFTDIFSLAYSRHKELQDKEEQNQQLRLNAAIERVRAEAAAMRSTDDITNLLTALDEGLEAAGVPVSNLVLNVTDPDADRLTVHIYTVEGVVPVKLPEHKIIWRNTDNGVIVARTEVRLSEYAVRGWDIGTSARIRNLPYTGQLLNDIGRMWELQIPEGVLPEANALVPFAFGELSLQRMADEHHFTQQDLDTAVHFADAVSLGYARYLDFQALEEANEEIQEATRLKSQFLATMSHELRTPMNAIIGFTRLVTRRAENLTERQSRNLENVSLSARHLLALINDILDLSKVEAGRVDLKPSTFALSPLLQQCCATVGPTLGKSNVELVCTINPQVGEVCADEDRLRQIVINLLSNALKFTDRGKVAVRARMTPLVIGETSEPGVEICVVDTGVGIPADKLDTVFEEFRQVDGSNTRRHQGTGLGLAITKRLIELMGGTIGATSEIGVGSVFTVMLPVTGNAVSTGSAE